MCLSWVEAMEWKGQSEWLNSPATEWIVNGQQAGSVKASGPLSFVKVSGAGHMVSHCVLAALI